MEIIWNLLSGVGIEVTMKTNLQPAPDDLLKIIRGQCKSSCDSKRCTCRKNGLECSSGCRPFQGISCSNAQVDLDIYDDKEYSLDTLRSNIINYTLFWGAQWLSGRVLDSRPRDRGFESHWHHCVVVFEQETFILA